MDASTGNSEHESEELSPTGRTILLAHEKPVEKTIVLLHGLTATPVQFGELGRRLHARGANVLIPRMPHHGHADRRTRALERLTEDELIEFGYRTLERARQLGGKIVFAGFSLGALVCLWLAQRETLDRVVAVAPFLGLPWLPHRFARRVARATLAMPNGFLWWHPIQRERFGEPHGYPRYATHAVARAYHLAHRLMEEAEAKPPATKAITLVTNASESTISNRAVRRLARRWRVHGYAANEHVLRGLPLSHDIIAFEPDPRLATRVYPQLMELIER